jgi:hypothetical protein
MGLIAVFAIEYLIAGGCAAYAWWRGGRGEQLGAAWFAASLAGSLIANLLQLKSPTAHLVQDGIFAVGLLPLAVIFVSYWIGLVTLVAAALFSLEAIYLINDWKADPTYIAVNNALWAAVLLIYFSAGLSNHLRCRRGGKAESGTAGVAALG